MSKKNNYIYSLRIALCPDFHVEEKFPLLLEFCKQAEIDDVQFFINQEEVNQGHLTIEETKEWLQMIGKMKPQLEAEGIQVSLNPWITLLHTDRGRELKPEQHFTLMADVNGVSAKAVACPLDGEFQNYIKEIYRLYAEMDFSVIWIDDDFRLHNHAPLTWGGCFCELHRKEFSKRIGKAVSVDEMVNGILHEGVPHPYRKVWLDTARDTMNHLAILLGEAVHDVASDTRVGLMSSAPEVHCTEGRDWDQILSGLSGKTRPLNRPHLPAYWEIASRKYALHFQRYSRLSAAMTGADVELWPELDNLPHTTFSKSHKFAAMEMESSLSLCAEGITINIFDLIGNGINTAQKNNEFLICEKAYLNAVKALQIKREQEEGVTVLFSTKSSYTLHTDGQRQMEAIQPWETFWAEYLSAFGIANKYSADYTVEGKILAVSGQYFRNLEKEAIKKLFADNTVLLEGEAVETLIDMGLGELIGVESAEWYPLNGGKHSFEEVANGEIYQNMEEARMSAQGIFETIETGDFLHIKYSANPEKILSVLKAANGRKVGEGLTYHENVIIFPYGHMRDEYNFLLNPIRAEMFQRLLKNLKGVTRPTQVENCQYVTVNDFIQAKRRVLLLTNYSTDDFENIAVYFTGKICKAYEISKKNGEKIPLQFEVMSNGAIMFFLILEHMRSRCIVIE